MSGPLIHERVVHCKRERYDVYVGRGGPWGNMFSHKEGTKARYVVASVEAAIEAYRAHIWQRIQDEGQPFIEQLAQLDGKVLGCWCSPNPCHGEVLVAAAEWAAQHRSAVTQRLSRAAP